MLKDLERRLRRRQSLFSAFWAGAFKREEGLGAPGCSAARRGARAGGLCKRRTPAMRPSRLNSNVAAAALLLIVASGNAYTAPPTTAHTVTIEALRYSPPTIEVNKGDTVVWRNKDPFPHTVTAQNRAFDSGQIAEGKSWKFKAKQSGEFTYICTLHPTMKGTLIVK